MQDAGLQPDVISFSAVIDACAKQGEAAKAEEWLSKMQAAGLQPNVISYSAATSS